MPCLFLFVDYLSLVVRRVGRLGLGSDSMVGVNLGTALLRTLGIPVSRPEPQPRTHWTPWLKVTGPHKARAAVVS